MGLFSGVFYTMFRVGPAGMGADQAWPKSLLEGPSISSHADSPGKWHPAVNALASPIVLCAGRRLDSVDRALLLLLADEAGLVQISCTAVSRAGS